MSHYVTFSTEFSNYSALLLAEAGLEEAVDLADAGREDAAEAALLDLAEAAREDLAEPERDVAEPVLDLADPVLDLADPVLDVADPALDPPPSFWSSMLSIFLSASSTLSMTTLICSSIRFTRVDTLEKIFLSDWKELSQGE